MPDSIGSLGDVQVEDITFTSKPTDASDDLTLTLYSTGANRAAADGGSGVI